MSTKAKTFQPTIGLLIESVSDNTWGGGFFHITAHPVIVGPEREDEPNRKPNEISSRLTSDSPLGGFSLGDLEIRSQGNSGDSPRRLYGFCVEYRNVFAVNSRSAEEMHKTLAKIERGLSKLSEKYGYVDSFSAYVGRVADIIGATVFVMRNNPRQREMTGEDVRIVDVQSGLYHVRHLEHEWSQPEQKTA